MNKEILTVKKDNYGTIRHYNASGQLHNANGPAVVYPNSDKSYYINGQLHNPDGPAIIDTDRSKSYWINDEELTKAEFKTWQAEQTK